MIPNNARLTQDRIKRNLQRAVALHQSGRIARAEACFRKILEDDPRHSDAWTLLGLIAFDREQLHLAIERLQQATAITQRSDAYGFLALAYQKLGDLEQSIQA